MSIVPPRSPRVTRSPAPGRTRSTSSPSRILGSTSSMLTPTRSASVSSGFGAGGRRSTSLPGISRRSSPCQPSATNGAETVAHPGPSSAATGPRRTASFERHSAGTTAGSIGSAAETQRCRRPAGPSRFSKTGPCSSFASLTATPASRRTASSSASAAAASTPTSARTWSPNRASVSEQ